MQWQALSRWFNPDAGSGLALQRTELKLVRRMFWVGLIVRIAYVTLARTYKITPLEDHFEFGWEAARIARSVATGHGYGNPFVLGNTGPTAWLPPLFPLLIAASFKLFGPYTPLAAWTVLACDCLFSAATAPAIFEIADRCFSPRSNRSVAIWSGWLWALYPAAMQYAVKWVWETTLTTMLFTWVLVLALRIRGIGSRDDPGDSQTLRRWLFFGLLWGLIGMSNPSVLLFLPVCGVWMLMGASDLRRSMGMAVASGLVFFACLAPWIWRNSQVFHAFVPMRGNLGAELYFGNNPNAEGFPWGHIVESQRDMERYAALGELRYVSILGTRAKSYIAAHPGRFLELCLKRVYFFWVSIPHPLGGRGFTEYFREAHYCLFSITGLLGLALALRQRIPASGLFAFAFLLVPATYYFVTVAARFRHPLEPLIVILTVYLFQSAGRRKTSPADAGPHR